MIIGMSRQLHDGMMSYEDGTPASTPQMAHDVSCFLDYLENHERGDISVNLYTIIGATAVWLFVSWFLAKYHEFNLSSCKFIYILILLNIFK